MPITIGMPASAGRSARMAHRNIVEDGGGIKICCCRVFTCFNINFLTTNHGLMKVSEVILATCCQTMLVQFGMSSASEIGQAFNTCLTTVSACLLTSTLLLICYTLSTRTFNLVRQSLFVSINLWLLFFVRNGENNLFNGNGIFVVTIGNFLQFVRLFYVFECFILHGIYGEFLAVSKI